MRVHKHFSSFEDVAADEHFQAWHFGTNPQQAKEWEQWLKENPQYQPMVAEAVHSVNTVQLPERPVSVEQIDAAHERLLQSLPQTAPVIRKHNGRRKWWLSAAAAVILLVGATLLLKSRSQEALKLNTAYGQIEQYKLPDGSDVMLNANSKLSMSKWKEGTDREVWIDGEAFFHVRKTSEKNRFIVHAKELDIIVTGTQFNVINRDGEMSVLLKEGSVTLKTADGKTVNMVPGDYVTIANRQPQKATSTPQQEKVLAWTQAKLVFENTTLREAQKIISRHYGVVVKLDKEIEDKTISGTLPNDNLDVLLKALEATMDFRIVRTNDEITISGPGER